MADSESILTRLASNDNEILREAAYEAGEGGCVEAVPRLAGLLTSANLGVQEAADRALRRIGGSETVHAVIPLLHSEEAAVRNLSMDILRQVGVQDLQSIIDLLTGEDPDIRIFAADILGASGNPLVVKPLCDALLNDSEVNVRYQAAVSLGELARPEAAQCLAKAMNDEEWVQYATVEALSKVGDAGSADALIQSLDHISDLVQSMVVDALAEVGNIKAATKLLKRMADAPDALRNKMVKAVVRILGGESLSLLTPGERENLRQYMLVALQDEAHDVQDAAMEGLAHLGGEQASRAILAIAGALDPDRDADRLERVLAALASIGLTTALTEGLSSDDPLVAGAAGAALAKVEDSGLPEVVMAVFWDSDQALQRQLINVVADRGGEESREFILDVLDRHQDGSVLKAAARFVGNREDMAEATEKLFALLDHPYDDVKEAALDALIGMDGPEIVARFRGMYASSDPLHRLISVFGVGKLGASDHLPFLKEALEDEVPDIRKVALEAVSTVDLDSGQWTSLIAPRLGDESREVRLAVVEIMGNCYSDAVAPYLEQALDDQDDWVRVRAVESLGRNRDTRAVPHLVKLLEHPNKLVTIKAVEALGQLGGQAAFRALLEITTSADEDLSRAAEEAVETIRRESSEGR